MANKGNGEKRFDVLIVKSEDREVVTVTGANLDARQAERRELSTLSRVNIGDYFVTQAPAGRFSKGSTYRGD